MEEYSSFRWGPFIFGCVVGFIAAFCWFSTTVVDLKTKAQAALDAQYKLLSPAVQKQLPRTVLP